VTVPEFDLADRLRKAREWAGLEQTELADRMGVSRGTVSNAETRARTVRRITVNAWARVTGVPVEWLLNGPRS
jgi:transcriptional regulator with XRE-family HTH domain